MINKEFIEPHTDEWYKVRLGKWTGSKMDLLFKKGRAKDQIFGEAALTHIDVLISQILTGMEEEATGKHIDWGLAHEFDAKERYQQILNIKVKDAGFFVFNTLSGSTPDFITEDCSGVGEIKCPGALKTYCQIAQLQTVEELKDYDPLYYHQPQSHIYFTGAEYCDFIAFDPRIKVYDAQMKIMRIYPDTAWQNDFEYRLGLAAEIMQERLEAILKIPEQIMQYRKLNPLTLIEQ